MCVCVYVILVYMARGCHTRQPLLISTLSDKFALADIKEIDYRGRDVVDRGQETASVPDTIQDPFTGSRVRVVKRVPRKGEAVSSSRLVVDLERFGR